MHSVPLHEAQTRFTGSAVKLQWLQRIVFVDILSEMCNLLKHSGPDLHGILSVVGQLLL